MYAGYLPMLTMMSVGYLAEYQFRVDCLEMGEKDEEDSSLQRSLDALDPELADRMGIICTMVLLSSCLFAHCNEVIMTRMQSVDYAHRNSFRKAIGDLLVRNRPLRQVFMCGLASSTIAAMWVRFFYTLSKENDEFHLDLISREIHEGQEQTVIDPNQFVNHDKYIFRPWMIFLGVTCLVYQPFNVLMRRVQFAGHESRTMLADGSANRNMWRAAKTVWRERGIRGFYAGMAPASVALMLTMHAHIYNRMTGGYNLSDIRTELQLIREKYGLVEVD